MDYWEGGEVSSEVAREEEVGEGLLIRMARLCPEKPVVFLQFIVLSAEFGLCEPVHLETGQ